VTVYDAISHGSAPVMAMEPIDGTSLRSLCGQALPAPQVARFGDQIEARERHGAARRLSEGAGFGLARNMLDNKNLSSSAGLPVETLRYMPPEQCRGEAATPASDVFAVGLVLTRWLPGSIHSGWIRRSTPLTRFAPVP
jgi:eukaryotic-like serine/threonine-protein kinase